MKQTIENLKKNNAVKIVSIVSVVQMDITDIFINEQVCTSFEDVMKFIYDFHNITDVKITTNTINRSLYVPGRYFNYRRYNFAEDYISNFLLQNVKYEK